MSRWICFPAYPLLVLVDVAAAFCGLLGDDCLSDRLWWWMFGYPRGYRPQPLRLPFRSPLQSRPIASGWRHELRHRIHLRCAECLGPEAAARHRLYDGASYWWIRRDRCHGTNLFAHIRPALPGNRPLNLRALLPAGTYTIGVGRGRDAIRLTLTINKDGTHQLAHPPTRGRKETVFSSP